MKKLILSIATIMCLISCSKSEKNTSTKVIQKQEVYGIYIGPTYVVGYESDQYQDTFTIKEQRDFYTDSLIISTQKHSFSRPDTLSGYNTTYTSTYKNAYQLTASAYVIDRDTTEIIFDKNMMKLEKRQYQYYFPKNDGYNYIGDATGVMITITKFVGIKQ